MSVFLLDGITDAKFHAIVYFAVQIAEKIRPTVDKYQQAFPALLEIPAKDFPYGLSLVSRCQSMMLKLFISRRSGERLGTQARPEDVRRVNHLEDINQFSETQASILS